MVLPYIDMNPPQVYMRSQSWTPLPPPTPYHLSGSSPCTSPKHPVSCIEHRLAIHFLHDSIYVSMPFSHIIPLSLSPSPSESKSPFYTSMSLLLSRIQGYHYHLSKFHIYVLVYCIGVFLDTCIWKISWRREKLPTLLFWPGEFHWLYSPWGRKESDTSEQLLLSRY